MSQEILDHGNVAQGVTSRDRLCEEEKESSCPPPDRGIEFVGLAVEVMVRACRFLAVNSNETVVLSPWWFD